MAGLWRRATARVAPTSVDWRCGVDQVKRVVLWILVLTLMGGLLGFYIVDFRLYIEFEVVLRIRVLTLSGTVLTISSVIWAYGCIVFGICRKDVFRE